MPSKISLITNIPILKLKCHEKLQMINFLIFLYTLSIMLVFIDCRVGAFDVFDKRWIKNIALIPN